MLAADLNASPDDKRSDLIPLEIERKIDELGDQFLRAWQSGARPRVEDYLDRVEAQGRGRLLEELLAEEFALRAAGGEAFDAAEYRARFPDHVATVEQALGSYPGRREMSDTPRAEKETNGIVPATTSEAVLPERIGRFRILGLLGRGSFGDVLLALDEQLGRKVALKVPHQERFVTAESREVFLREARTAAQLQHPGLVAVYDVQEQQGSLCIVQEFIHGQDLASWAGQRPVAPQVAAQVLREVAEAVDFAHRRGFVHRDLKPANILMDAAGNPHVADFGLAVHETDQWTRKGEVSGSPAYMSPEQVRGETQYIDGRSDLWGLGVILYELLTGRRPFTATTRTDLQQEILEREPKPPRMIDEAIPAELERIVLKCLAKPVADRYATARDLAQDLDRYLHPPAVGRRWLTAALAVLTLLSITGLLVFWLAGLGKPQPPVRIESVEIEQLTWKGGNAFARPGLVLQVPYQLREQDGVQFRARLSRPAYCYWIAFRPDGVDEVCFPDDPKQPPPLTDTPVYPSENPDSIYYRLSDGVGMQAFVLVVSDTPLPAYNEWSKGLPKPPWEPKELGTLPAVFHHDGHWEETFPLDRVGPTRGAGAHGQMEGTRSPLDGLVRWVRASNKAAVIEAWALPVLPREGAKP